MSNVSELLVWLLTFGAFGGLVNGLVTRRSYLLRIPFWIKKVDCTKPLEHEAEQPSVELGTVGDMLVGAAASIAIISIAVGLLDLKLNDLATRTIDGTAAALKIAALGILAGYSGIKMLDGMSTSLIKKIIVDEVKTSLNDVSRRKEQSNIQAEMDIRKGEDIVEEYNRETNECANLPLDKLDDFEKTLNRALLRFNSALEVDSVNPFALNGKARVYKRQALIFLKRNANDKYKEFLNKAINELNVAIKCYPEIPVLYFNKACLYSLLKNKDETLHNLAKAIEIDSIHKKYAIEDQDFALLKNDVDFIKITT